MRLIDADLFEVVSTNKSLEFCEGMKHVLEMIDSAPTVDAVEVVRCKDCKYSEDYLMGGLWCNHPDNRNPLGCRPNDYCNDGERKCAE